MLRQSPQTLARLQSALKIAKGDIHLALQYLVILFLKKYSDNDIKQSIDVLLDLNANPGFSSVKFKDMVKSEFNCPDFIGDWSAIKLICRRIPTNENLIELTATLLLKLRELNMTIPTTFLEAMFDKIQQPLLREKFYNSLNTFLPKSLEEKVKSFIKIEATEFKNTPLIKIEMATKQNFFMNNSAGEKADPKLVATQLQR